MIPGYGVQRRVHGAPREGGRQKILLEGKTEFVEEESIGDD